MNVNNHESVREKLGGKKSLFIWHISKRELGFHMEKREKEMMRHTAYKGGESVQPIK